MHFRDFTFYPAVVARRFHVHGQSPGVRLLKVIECADEAREDAKFSGVEWCAGVRTALNLIRRRNRYAAQRCLIEIYKQTRQCLAVDRGTFNRRNSIARPGVNKRGDGRCRPRSFFNMRNARVCGGVGCGRALSPGRRSPG